MSVQNAAASIAGLAVVTAASAVLAVAAVAIAGHSTFVPSSEDQDEATASIHGQGTVVALGGYPRHAAAVIGGASTFTATGHSGDEPRASLVGLGIFFVDPTKVAIIPFFSPTAVPTSSQPSPAALIRKYQPGQVSNTLTLGIPATTLNTKTGGVPHKG